MSTATGTEPAFSFAAHRLAYCKTRQFWLDGCLQRFNRTRTTFAAVGCPNNYVASVAQHAGVLVHPARDHARQAEHITRQWAMYRGPYGETMEQMAAWLKELRCG